jgi:hypothetical protein
MFYVDREALYKNRFITAHWPEPEDFLANFLAKRWNLAYPD